ncbi:trihelix transcription factor ASIL1-like [Rhizophagus clarus]|uniref:Trihelix transcription factor ASIL1-like n=1 Tax=Rhizophagus clarus TaxID=94130 RepID=A0A8H3LY37_9GLOM|nr:trihelix transcription factor ASIL1-like [Rhizophagus clarus]
MVTSKNKKKGLSTSNINVNTNVKLHPKSTTLERSNLPIKITSEPTLTHKETTQTIIDLSDDLIEPTKNLDAETTQAEPQKIEVSMPPMKDTKRKKQVLKKEVKSNDDGTKWTDSEIKILLEFWREKLEEWKQGKVKVYQKIVSENVLPGRTLDQIRNKVGKLRETYLQKKKKTNSTGEGSVEWIWFSQMEEILSQSKAINPDYITDSTSDSPPISDSENSNNSKNSNDKENYKADEPRKKKRKSTGIEGISEVIAAMGESRDRFYEKKLDLEERENQKKFELEEKKLNQQYELEKSKLEIERLRAENEKVKLELEMLKFRKNNE